MLRTLYRYIFVDLLRVVVLTTVILVTVIAFGAAIKPLARGTILDAGQALKFIAIAIIPMLQFAIPFAAGFAGTMSLHRMTAENEVVAAAVSGISYKRLLVPVAALGIALTILMVLLTQWVIPRFWGLLEEVVLQDVTKFFQAPIDRGDSFEIGDLQIRADRLTVDRDPEGTDADVRLILDRVAVAELDAAGRVKMDVTAAQVVADIHKWPEATIVNFVMLDAVIAHPEAGTLSWISKYDAPARVIPRVMEDDPLWKTRTELLELRRDPDRYRPALEAKMDLVRAMRDAEQWLAVQERLVRDGRVRLTDLGPEHHSWTIRADRLAGWRLSREGGERIEIVRDEGTGNALRFRSQDATLRAGRPGALDAPAFDVVMRRCEVTDLELPESANEREEVVIERLAFAGIDVEDRSREPSAALIERAAALESAGAAVKDAVARLEFQRAVVEREVTGQLMRRYALSVLACLVMLLGATFAMWLRNTPPLMVYLWAFLPSVLDMILISSGAHVAFDGHVVAGIALMWSGHAVMVLLLIAAYLRLARN